MEHEFSSTTSGSARGSSPSADVLPRTPREPDAPDITPPVTLPDDFPPLMEPGQLPVGSIGNKFSPYDGLLDDEADELKKELEKRDKNRSQLGFHQPGTHFYRGRRVKDRRKK